MCCVDMIFTQFHEHNKSTIGTKGLLHTWRYNGTDVLLLMQGIQYTMESMIPHSDVHERLARRESLLQENHKKFCLKLAKSHVTVMYIVEKQQL